jgi:phenylpyruvate tautomerase PptA (4-oxalocrotonate tautomerase family)
MSYLMIDILEGVSRGQKAGLVFDVTRSLVDHMISHREDANAAEPSQ